MTRMWMVSTNIMCRNHLLGEHKEIHQLLGHLRKKKKVTKYIENNCLEIISLVKRHDELINEMLKRGYNHKSPIHVTQKEVNEMADYLPKEHVNYNVDAKESLKDLFKRCNKCYKGD